VAASNWLQPQTRPTAAVPGIIKAVLGGLSAGLGFRRLGSDTMAEDSGDAIFRAVEAGDVDALRELVATLGTAAVRLDDDPEKLTALHWAAARGHMAAVEYLLSPAVGADPRAARKNNFTPLHAAAMQGHAAVCEVLLRAGAGVNLQTDPQGYAPLHSAAFAGHLEAIRVLLAHGADRTLKNYRGERPADTARRQGQDQAAELLEAHPA
jgi:ankyrin repeat protein